MVDEPSHPAEDAAPFAVVAIVTSAGGLDAVTRVLRELPADLPVPVVLAQHLSGQGSHLVEILQRRIPLEVAWADEGGQLRPGLVTVARPRTLLEVLPDGSCSAQPLHSVVADRPLDRLLASVADSFGDAVLAVVLTGMGNDGAAGARAVHAAGGTVLVQDEETSEHPSMPRAVATAGAADRVLAVHVLGRAVVDLVAGRGLPPSSADVAAVRSLFAGPAEVARLARERDWSTTELGPVGGWSAALRTTVRLVLEAPLAMCLLWGPRHIQLYNDGYRDLMGVKHPAGLGQANRDCWPEVWHLNEGIYAQVLAGSPVQVREALYPITRSGVLENAWFDLFFTPIRDEAGAVGGILATVVERTTQVLADRRLRTLHELGSRTAGTTTWRTALESALAAIAVDGEDVLFAVGYRIDGVGSVALLVDAVGVEAGGPMAPSRVELDTGDPGWPLARAARLGEPLLVEDVAARFGGPAGPDGLVPEAALLVPLREPGADSPNGLLVLGVHPRLPLDAAYREFLWLAGREVAARVVEARGRERERERLARLAELDRAKTEFFSNVSHEFRTPLTLMLGPLEALHERRADLPEELRADVELAGRNARRLLRMVGSLLDFSRAEAGRLRPAFAPTDLSRLTADVAGLFRSAAERAGIELRVDAPRLPQPVWVDPQMWEKVLSNLLANALKFTFEGVVEVSVRPLPKHVEVQVRDTGVGIPADDLPHLFQRFHRVRGTRARTHEGAGIGLALVDELVRRHHGRVRVRSEVGVGTTFTVWLPLGRRPAADHPGEPVSVARSDVAAALAEEVERWVTAAPVGEEAVLAEPADDPGAQPDGIVRRALGARVLVVDDNADARDYLRRLLEPHWRVATARDGVEALEAARALRPDLVLADVVMPRLDGSGLLRALRGDDGPADVPVVLVTARAGEESAVEGLLAGADDYIVKPFSPRELLARIGAQLELARLRRRSAGRWRALVDASFDVVYRMNADWTEMHALDGRGFIADTDRPTASWLDQYIHPDDQPLVTRAIEEAVRTGNVFELEHRVRRPDGSLGWVLSRAVPLLDEHGRVEEWVGAASDVTARRQAEEARRAGQEGLRSLPGDARAAGETRTDGCQDATRSSWRVLP
ncbi:chemotaxis protein CheB [Geodermatophilus sp. TF02-6]|uniref:chemotaxis protein CheB n=1 Tax=Geodermatophilus sp. TF02-6 TaxID=2250575 RepID=UPI0011BF2E53|nr:chemotaxis protein CheB [Geodermatophilus sp. TF02-6]